ncbi:hypothetical protein V1634_24645 [Plantactinospora veratri]|uniref:RNase H type-1 domain-containing protein n=1 Tax=Plantactinospora veratri TaxID=1436122 RepID=A0ABU7SJ84_9ACTN
MAENNAFYVCKECLVICVPRQSASADLTLIGQPDQCEHPTEARERWPRATCNAPVALRRAKPQEVKKMRGIATKKDRYRVRGRLAGLAVPPGQEIELAIVGYVEEGPKTPPLAWGYLAGSGHWGLGANIVPRRIGGDEVVGAEGRALFWGLRVLFPRERNPVIVVTDYPEIAELIEAWRAGRTEEMPPDYQTHHPDSGREGKLALIARYVARYPHLIRVRLVEDYIESTYARGANELSKVGWAYAMHRMTKAAAMQQGLTVASQHLKVPPFLLPPDHDDDDALT